MSSLCLEKSQRFNAGLLFFFFSSNRRSAVLKLCKSWYETLFFADRVVIAAKLNSLEILLFRSVIRYTADNCQRARNVLDFWRCSSIGWEDLHLEVEQTANNPHPLPLSSQDFSSKNNAFVLVSKGGSWNKIVKYFLPTKIIRCLSRVNSPSSCDTDFFI